MRLVSLAEGITNLQIAALQGGVTINARVGEPYGTIQGTDYVYYEWSEDNSSQWALSEVLNIRQDHW